MPSSYSLSGDMRGPLCLRCGMVLTKNLYCMNCGYFNESMQVTIAEQETQPSPALDSMQATILEQETQPSSAFLALPEDPASQLTQKLNQYHEQSQNLPSGLSRRSVSSVRSSSSATPFLGISLDGPFFPPQGSKSFTKAVPSQSTLSQTDLEQSFGSESSVSSSFYSTQPTLSIPARLQKRLPEDLDTKQVSQYKSRRRQGLSVVFISIVVLMIGGVASYLFVDAPVVQKSTSVPVTASAVHSKESSKLVDVFKDNRNRWDLRSEAGKYSAAIANGNLVLEDESNSLLPELLPGNRSFDNFKIAVDAVLSKGDKKNGYGVYIRCAPDQNGNPATYYRFELYGDGTYAVFRGDLDRHGRANSVPLKLVSYTASPVIQKRGDSNHIEISAKEAIITIWVNGQKLRTLADVSYTKGKIALFISNIQNAPRGAQAKFSNLVIYPL